MIIVLIGVTGSGKSTIGALLATELHWPFYEGDELHPPANIEKLRSGVALTDEDRIPWLMAIRKVIRAAIDRGEDAVIASSALKDSYRRMLQIDPEVVFVYLKANSELIRERLKHRTGHFINPALIESQFDTLEEPLSAVHINADLPPEEIVRIIRRRLAL
jgi:gluconokinase